MRGFRWLICAVVFLPSIGCTWVKDNLGIRTPNPNAGTGPLPSVQPEQLVGYINERAGRMQSITYNDVHLRAFERGMPTPVIIGSMACAQPRSFRLKGQGRVGGDLDLGSNSEQFWAYLRATGEPMYIYASYADFDSGRARLPAGMPFEPDWVMQVVGMTSLPPSNQYQVAVDDKNRTYTLSWAARTPQGQAVRKEIVFEGDPAVGTRPQVRKHVVKDAQSGKTICTAEVKRAQTVQAGNGILQYPTQVSLKWEEQKFEMDLSMNDAKVNEPLTPEMAARRFEMPRNVGTNPINLAEYRLNANARR